MKKVIIGISLFVFNVYALAKELDPNGFREMKWEDSISKYKDALHLTADENKPSKFYTKENDDMSYGNINLKSIAYVFYKGKFSSVIFQTNKSASYSKQLLEMFKKTYGKPVYSNKYTKKFRDRKSVA